MTNSYTKAPWKVEPDSRVGSITITHQSDGCRSHVAVLPRSTLCEEHGTIEANASLIAAAPELLAAIKNLVSARPAFRSKPMGAPGSVARAEQEYEIRLEDEALAIIRKATGAV